MTAQRQAARTVLIPQTVTSHRPRRDARVMRLSGLTMGTTWSAVFYAPPAVDETEITAAISRMLDRVVQQMSTWLPASDISRYNSAAPGTWHDLKDEFFTVLAAALDLAERTEGAFDPSAGALVQLWGFGSSGSRTVPPSAGEVADARARSGWRRVDFDIERRRVRQPGGLQLDLSSIAKGFGVDEIGRCLERRGVASYLCEIGGELRGAGMKADGSPWWVALEVPPGSGVDETLVALHGISVATSGDYVRRYAHEGQAFAHTLDPRTGAPLQRAVTVSVIAADCMTADAMATALSVLGPDDGLAFADRYGVAARVLTGEPAVTRYSAAAAAFLD